MKVVSRPLASGYTIFCDDIRQEILGKITLVGVYSSELTIFSATPVLLPRLAMLVTYEEIMGSTNDPLELHIYFPGDPDGAPFCKSTFSQEMLDGLRNVKSPEGSGQVDEYVARARLNLVFSPIEIKQEGNIRVRMLKGEELIKLGALRIYAKPPSDTE